MSVVDGAAHTQKDDVKSNRGSLENVAKVFVLFLCGVQLVLRSGVLTVLDLDKVDVTPRFAEVFRSVLSGVGGSSCTFCQLRCQSCPYCPWDDHLHRHFRVARTFEEPRPSAVDMAVPCSKNHPPSENPFQAGRAVWVDS